MKLITDDAFKLASVYETEIVTNENTLDQYDKILSKYSEWKAFKREIKLLNLLEAKGKKIKFDIDDVFIFGVDSIGISCFTIHNISFILDGNNVYKLIIKFKTMNNIEGNFIKEFISNNIKVDINQIIKNGCVIRFYIDISSIIGE